MDDFKQAVQWMREGKKVRRKNCNWHLILNSEDEPIVKEQNSVQTDKLNLREYEATDWEIYEEPKCKNCGVLLEFKNHECKCKEEDNWNLADKTVQKMVDEGEKICYEHLFHIADIKIFIEKIKQDDTKSDNSVKKSQRYSTEYWRGYNRAMYDTNLHRNKRAGDL